MHSRYSIDRGFWPVLALFLVFAAAPAMALTFSISEKDINLVVQQSFPQKKIYDGATVYFANPKVFLDGLDNRVRITTEITAIRNNQLLKATGELSGELKFDAIDYNLQIKQPMLSEFEVLESTMEDASQLIRGIRDVVGQSLPLIVLIDLERFDLGFGQIKPQAIEVKQRKLVITF